MLSEENFIAKSTNNLQKLKVKTQISFQKFWKRKLMYTVWKLIKSRSFVNLIQYNIIKQSEYCNTLWHNFWCEICSSSTLIINENNINVFNVNLFYCVYKLMNSRSTISHISN